MTRPLTTSEAVERVNLAVLRLYVILIYRPLRALLRKALA